MFRDGIYQIAYVSDLQPERVDDEALVIVRDGQIMGSDPHGGVYLGSMSQAKPTEAIKLRVRAEIPPEGVLVTGFTASAEGASLAVSGTLDPEAENQRATVNIGDESVAIEVTYLGPLL
jgi:hypothetical protein